MIKTKKQKIMCFFLASIFIFTATFFVNPSRYLSDESESNFDWWSESLIYADLLYHNEYQDSNVTFSKSLIPTKLSKIYGGNWSDYENSVKDAYLFGDNQYKESDYGDYTSNIVVQRFFYNFLDNVLPFSNSLKIRLFYILHCLLLAISISIILCWIIKIFKNFHTGIAIIILFAFFAPNLLMYGKNLYWCSWTLFLPTVMMILLINSKFFSKTKHKLLYLSICVFLAIFIKCLFYFEFVTTVMISMMIPVIYYLLSIDNEAFSIKKKLLYFTIISLSAIFSFLLVNGIKFLMLTELYGSASEAFNTFFGNLQNRVFGNTDTDKTELIESANASIIYVLARMLVKPLIDLKPVFSITELGLVILTFLSSVILIFLHKKEVSLVTKNHRLLLLCTWISFLAPISWFILAKPHTYVHPTHCSITWFIIFDFMALALIALTISIVIRIVRNNLKSASNETK